MDWAVLMTTMKRRYFIKGSGLILGGLIVPRPSLADPCAPDPLKVEGGKSGSSSFCGEKSSSEAPAWVDSLSSSQWTPLPNTNFLSDVYAPNTGQYGNTGPQSVFIAWCGAAFVRNFGNSGSMFHWGGGHQDYYGNEIYSFDLNTLTWTRLTDPSIATWTSTHTDGILPDGRPRVPHSTYDITSDESRLIISKREINNQGGNYVWQLGVFDPSDKSWTLYTDSDPIGLKNGDGIVWDSNRGVCWSVAQQPVGLAKIDPDVGTWTGYTAPSGNYNNRAGCVYVPTKDCLIAFPDGPVFGLDPGNPTGPRVDLTTSGSGPTYSSGDIGHWSSNLNAIVYYKSRSNTIYTLTAPSGDWKTGTWTWSLLSLSGTTGTHDGTPGTYGKFQLAEWGGATVGLLNADTDGPCQAIRLT